MAVPSYWQQTIAGVNTTSIIHRYGQTIAILASLQVKSMWLENLFSIFMKERVYLQKKKMEISCNTPAVGAIFYTTVWETTVTTFFPQ